MFLSYVLHCFPFGPLAMPQPGTPLQSSILHAGFSGGRSVSDVTLSADGSQQYDVGSSSSHTMEANLGPVDQRASDACLLSDQRVHASQTLTSASAATATAELGSSHQGGHSKQLGCYARCSLRMTTRLPVSSASPSLSKALLSEIPKPTMAARLKPRSRAVAKMLVRSRLRCQCCFHRLGFCMRENMAVATCDQ